MCVVQNGVDIERIDSVVKDVSITCQKRFTITTVGLIDIKNPGTVLTAFYQAFDAASDLLVLGEGYLRPSLMQTIRNWNLEDAAKLTGLVPRNRVYEWLWCRLSVIFQSFCFRCSLWQNFQIMKKLSELLLWLEVCFWCTWPLKIS